MPKQQPQDQLVIDIRELDPDTIEPSAEHARDPTYTKGGSKITVIGRPGSGKSFLITSLIYEKRACFPSAMIISGTEDSNHHFETYFPSTFIHDDLNLDCLEKYKLRQKHAKEKDPVAAWSVLLLDDCMDDPKMFNRPIFQGMYKNGRHWNMLLILSLQHCMDIKPVIRTSIDGVFILREPVMKTRKAIYENYASIIPTFQLFCAIMDQITCDYTALYINNKLQSNDWRECIFWYRAQPVPKNWKFGSPWYWQFHSDRFDHDRKK